MLLLTSPLGNSLRDSLHPSYSEGLKSLPFNVFGKKITWDVKNYDLENSMARGDSSNSQQSQKFRQKAKTKQTSFVPLSHVSSRQEESRGTKKRSLAKLNPTSPQSNTHTRRSNSNSSKNRAYTSDRRSRSRSRSKSAIRSTSSTIPPKSKISKKKQLLSLFGQLKTLLEEGDD